MANLLSGCDAKQFALLEDYLARTTRLLTEQAAVLRELAAARRASPTSNRAPSR